MLPALAAHPRRGIVRIEVGRTDGIARIHAPIWARNALKASGASWNPDLHVWTIDRSDVLSVALEAEDAGLVVHIDNVTDSPQQRVARRQHALAQMRATNTQRQRRTTP